MWSVRAVILMLMPMLALAAAEARADARAELPPLASMLEGIRSGRIKTRDELLSRLPMELKANFTLEKMSTAARSHCVTPEYPRAVLFSPADRMILTFNGNPLPGCQNIELTDIQDRDGYAASYLQPLLIEVGPGPEEKILRVLDDPNNSDLPADEKCASCHTSDFKAFWDSYPNWKRKSYGGSDDYLPTIDKDGNTPAETQEFFDRRSVWMKKGPYRHLDWRAVGTYPSFPYSTVDKDKNWDLRPNFRLGILLAETVTGRAARLADADPVFQREKWRLFKKAACGELDDYPENWKSFERLGLDLRNFDFSEPRSGDRNYRAGSFMYLLTPAALPERALDLVLRKYPEAYALATRPNPAKGYGSKVVMVSQGVQSLRVFPRKQRVTSQACAEATRALALAEKLEAAHPPVTLPRTGESIFGARCLGCHLPLDLMGNPKVSERLESGSMPPVGDELADDEREKVVRWLEAIDAR